MKTDVTKVTSHPEVYLSIADGDDVGHLFEKFEWRAFTNGGYIIRGRIRDSYWDILKKFVETQGYLDNGRRRPTRVVFEIQWPGQGKTGRHLAYLTDIDASGIQTGGGFEFIAVDPPSWWLNAGDCSGDVYEGSVKTVIEQVVNKYYIGPNNGKGNVFVSDTLDNVKNKWYMMRMDPKTFIGSLLDWASSVTEKKTNYIVSSDGSIDRGEPLIQIMEQATKPSLKYGTWIFNTRASSAGDGYWFNFQASTYLSAFQKQLITQGISAVSERYMDRITDKEREIVHVYDENTENKINADIDKKRGFKKPGAEVNSFEMPHEWSTSVMSIPEHNAGDLGITYDKYIDGRARTMFLNMLNLVMRLKIRVTGEPLEALNNAATLGTSVLKIAWIDQDPKGGEAFFLDGNWIVYGYHHVVRRSGWYTDIYLSRLDYDAEAKKISVPEKGDKN